MPLFLGDDHGLILWMFSVAGISSDCTRRRRRTSGVVSGPGFLGIVHNGAIFVNEVTGTTSETPGLLTK